jgi:hypothetical protein
LFGTSTALEADHAALLSLKPPSCSWLLPLLCSADAAAGDLESVFGTLNTSGGAPVALSQPRLLANCNSTFACCHCDVVQTLLLAVSRSQFKSLFGPHTALAAMQPCLFKKDLINSLALL